MAECPVRPQLVVHLVVAGCGAELCRFDVDEIELLGPLRMLDHLARMQLAALRCGARIRVVELPPSLADLVDVVGLCLVLGIDDGLIVGELVDDGSIDGCRIEGRGRPTGPPLAG